PFRPGNSGASGNQGFWRDDLIRINGFDEAFTGWGHEDLEILHRLQNIGIEGWVCRHKAIVFHILNHGLIIILFYRNTYSFLASIELQFRFFRAIISFSC
ncbi:MAG: hypothetical protein GY796_06205, partial [Chloroflexi bacterium]|nr:hypothetical protein [Chloroflexota bacterium]